ncbi:MAG: acetate/propionate family kinase [Nitrospiraceae bacterium]|nr:MAG: acetate/propionate family kinase [Nitrospiraceae bacterium]
MAILAVNAGSSSVRFAAFEKKRNGVGKIASRKYALDESSSSILKTFLRDNGIYEISAVAHRVVHGGTKFSHSCLINPSVESEIDKLSSLAPLHNPFALNWIRMCRAEFGDHVPQVAVFDTAFYAALSEVSMTYALPADLMKKHHIRRYGFHGIAHSAMWKRWKELHPHLKDSRLISLQLGAGCSITAVRDGKVLDTSMGFSPLEGLVMATRSGDIDPGIILHLGRSCGLSFDEIETMLNHSSGLLGVSGISSDMKALLESSHPDASRAIDLFCYRAKKYLGAYLAVLQGADAVLFGGGIGENAPKVRENILEGMQWTGIFLDTQANNATMGTEGCISLNKSKPAVWVIPADEASVLAEEAVSIVCQT